MQKFGRYLFALCAAVAMVACVYNDIPYPRLDCSLTGVSVAGGKGHTAVVSGDTTIVTIDVDESVDLRAVPFVSVTINNQDKAKIGYADGRELREGDKWNLRAGEVLVSEVYGYRTYYKIVGEQTIIKRFRIEGQIGESYFEENEGQGFENRIALANVAKGTDFSAINVLELKLGPEGETTITPHISGLTDFTVASGKVVTVSYRDVQQTWRIIVQEGTTSVTDVVAWTKSAEVYGSGTPDEAHSIEYRRKGDESWSVATLTSDANGVFAATINDLLPTTEYECRAVSGDEHSGVVEFTTNTAVELENSGFEKWHKSGKIWLPYAESDPIVKVFTDPTHPGQEFDILCWDTGNHGAATLGDSNSIPLSEAVAKGLTTTTPKEGQDAAFLQSKFVGIGVAGKIAGGNIFTGTFGVVQGTNGTTYLGVPFTARPKRLVGYYKYTPKPIDNVIKPDGVDGTFITEEWRGKSDTLNMVFALGGWDIPHEVRTDRRNRAEFHAKTPGVLAWGSFASAEERTEWTRFEIELNYYDRKATPTYMVIMLTASKWCDFFTGAAGSTLIVDDLQLEYE